MSTLWVIGESHVGASIDSTTAVRKTLTLCEWSLEKQVIDVTFGYAHSIYTIKSEREELLCHGFIRESQKDLPFRKNPFYIIPDLVSALCFLYLEQLKQYWAAGNHEYGQCGVENDVKQNYLPLSRIDGMDDALKVKIGVRGFMNLWIKYDGSLYVNGSNDEGQMGTGDYDDDDVYTPELCTFTQQHSELQVVDGSSSCNFTVVVADNGSVWFAGKLANPHYECLDGGSKFIPLTLSGDDIHIVSVSTGEVHAVFRTQNGSVLSVGMNRHGQLGLGENSADTYSKLQPISFFDENNIEIQSVCCGGYHNLALSTDGKVYGWGRNTDGQCGVSDGENRDIVWTPELIDIELDVAVKRIECGDTHSGLITVDNELYLWGLNTYNACCANTDNGEIDELFTPQNVTDYVLSESKKDRIIDFYLGCCATLFLLE